MPTQIAADICLPGTFTVVIYRIGNFSDNIIVNLVFFHIIIYFVCFFILNFKRHHHMIFLIYIIIFFKLQGKARFSEKNGVMKKVARSLVF